MVLVTGSPFPLVFRDQGRQAAFPPPQTATLLLKLSASPPINIDCQRSVSGNVLDADDRR